MHSQSIMMLAGILIDYCTFIPKPKLPVIVFHLTHRQKVKKYISQNL